MAQTNIIAVARYLSSVQTLNLAWSGAADSQLGNCWELGEGELREGELGDSSASDTAAVVACSIFTSLQYFAQLFHRVNNNLSRLHCCNNKYQIHCSQILCI